MAHLREPIFCTFVHRPLSSVPKKDSTDRRTIMDLSFLLGTSVNDGIPKDTYMGDPFKLHYPATKVDYHLLGLVWNSKLYFDTKIPLGLRTGAMLLKGLQML